MTRIMALYKFSNGVERLQNFIQNWKSFQKKTINLLARWLMHAMDRNGISSRFNIFLSEVLDSFAKPFQEVAHTGGHFLPIPSDYRQRRSGFDEMAKGQWKIQNQRLPAQVTFKGPAHNILFYFDKITQLIVYLGTSIGRKTISYPFACCFLPQKDLQWTRRVGSPQIRQLGAHRCLGQFFLPFFACKVLGHNVFEIAKIPFKKLIVLARIKTQKQAAIQPLIFQFYTPPSIILDQLSLPLFIFLTNSFFISSIQKNKSQLFAISRPYMLKIMLRTTLGLIRSFVQCKIKQVAVWIGANSS